MKPGKHRSGTRLEALTADSSHGPEVAFIVDENRVIFARGARRAHCPGRPLLDLLLGIHEGFPADAFRLIRRRVYSTGAEEALERALVQVCASKLSAVAELDEAPLGSRALVDVGVLARRVRERAALQSRLALPHGGSLKPEQMVAHAERLARELPTRDAEGGGSLPRYRRHRAVVAMLVDAQGIPRLAARNLNGSHRPLHAEVNLLLQWWEQAHAPIPAGWRVVTSLQSCRMCAAMLVHCASDAGIEALYAEPDAGRFSRCTALQERGWERHVVAGRHYAVHAGS